MLFFAALGLAYLTRSQAIVVAAAAVTAPLLLGLFQRGALPGDDLGLPLALRDRSSAARVLVVAAQTARGMPLSSLLGSYAVIVSDGNYDVGKAAHFVVYHAAELDLYLGVIPVAAAIVLTARARSLDRALQVLLASTITLVVLDAARRRHLRLAVRRPDPGAQHVRGRAAVPDPAARLGRAGRAAATRRRERWPPPPPRCSILAIPFDRFVTTSAVSDTLMLLPWWAIQLHWHITWLDVARLPRRRRLRRRVPLPAAARRPRRCR